MFMESPQSFLDLLDIPFDCSYCDTTYAFTEEQMSIDEF